MGDEYGHVKISRKFFADDPFWNEPREYSRAEAWMDIVQEACWKSRRWTVPGTDIVHLRRGETRPLSIRHLAERWRWGAKKVRVFMDRLIEMERIEVGQGTTQGTTYYLPNYDAYQSSRGTGKPSDDAPKGDSGAQLINNDSEDRGTPNDTPRGTGKPSNANDARDSGAQQGAQQGAQRGHSEGTIRRQLSSEGKEQQHPSGAADASPAPWSNRAVDAWRDRMGGTAPAGRIGAALKPLVEEHGAGEVLATWDGYLRTMVEQHREQYANPQHFAQRYGRVRDWLEGQGQGESERPQLDDYDYDDATTDEETVRWTA